jgi:RNA polymerase sigma factor (TIGR02999 family)
VANDHPPPSKTDDITRLLAECADDRPGAHARLLEAVYTELHRMAQARMRAERAGHTLGATALVNEAYLKLFRSLGGRTDVGGTYANRRDFFHAAAAAMRRILIDHARARSSRKRARRDPAAQRRIPLDVLTASESVDPADLLSLDEAISRLEHVDARAAEVVHLRFFAGQELAKIAELLNVSTRTVKRDWEFARAWLQQLLESVPLADNGPAEDSTREQPPLE